MHRLSLYLVLTLLLWGTGADPVLANKFETISGGVNGMNREKIELLKTISLYAGGFLLFLSLLALVTRKRFEGFIGYSSRSGGSSTTLTGVAILTVAGTVFIGLSFL
jgi:hypothetical protein